MNKISLGFGNNTDYELVWDTMTIESLINEFNIKNEDIQKKAIIDNERDLLIGMLHFLKKNIGGECNVSSTEVLKKFASRFDYNITIGGTAPRAAIAMNLLGYNCFLHLVVMNDDLKKLIPSSIEYICSNKETNYDIHLIFQYPKDISIKANDISIQTNRANRIIIGNNDVNSVMKLSQDFFDKYVKNSNVLMISGFNNMTDLSLLKNRLSFIVKNIKESKDLKVFYEDAHFVCEEANQLCKDILFKHVNVFSFNEDELNNYCNRVVDLLDEEDVLKAIEELYKKLQVETLVVHSRYWAIAYGKNANTYKPCLKGGITMATTRFRFGDNFLNKSQYLETDNLEDGETELKFATKFNSIANNVGLCVPSVKVDETDVTTVGLGDSFVGGFVSKLSELK